MIKCGWPALERQRFADDAGHVLGIGAETKTHFIATLPYDLGLQLAIGTHGELDCLMRRDDDRRD